MSGERRPAKATIDPETGRAATLARDPFDVSWRERIAVLGGVGIALLCAYALGMSFAPRATLELTGLVPASFFAAGKFLPLWGISGRSNFGPYQLGLVIWLMDTCTVLAIVYALEGIYRVRPLKRGLERMHANARLVLTAYPRMRRAAVIGIVIFVLFPVAGTGAVGAACIGILLGMHRGTLIAAVSLGGLLGGTLMAFVAVHFESTLRSLQQAQHHATWQYLFVGGAVTLLAAVVVLANVAYRRALAGARREPER